MIKSAYVLNLICMCPIRWISSILHRNRSLFTKGHHKARAILENLTSFVTKIYIETWFIHMLSYFPLWTWTRIVSSSHMYAENSFWAPTIWPLWSWYYLARLWHLSLLVGRPWSRSPAHCLPPQPLPLPFSVPLLWSSFPSSPSFCVLNIFHVAESLSDMTGWKSS